MVRLTNENRQGILEAIEPGLTSWYCSTIRDYEQTLRFVEAELVKQDEWNDHLQHGRDVALALLREARGYVGCSSAAELELFGRLTPDEAEAAIARAAELAEQIDAVLGGDDG